MKWTFTRTIVYGRSADKPAFRWCSVCSRSICSRTQQINFGGAAIFTIPAIGSGNVIGVPQQPRDRTKRTSACAATVVAEGTCSAVFWGCSTFPETGHPIRFKQSNQTHQFAEIGLKTQRIASALHVKTRICTFQFSHQSWPDQVIPCAGLKCSS